ncbi:MAG: ROK family protein [Clostridia bacterium]|nr:ROK family protein [Clostridia bacterium]
MNENKRYYIGIDLGGTFIKGGICTREGELLINDKIATEGHLGGERVAENVSTLTKKLISELNISPSDVVGVGMGVPGLIDSESGTVVFWGKMRWENFPIGEMVSSLTGYPTRVINDANAAALGETLFGSGKKYKNTVLLTLGTGVGGGVVIDGKLFEGNRSAGAELGHIVVVKDGVRCNCGRHGCLEAYASATALIRETRRAMEEDKTSKMWQIGSLDAVTGETAFDYASTDAAARRVVDNYLEMLGIGIVNYANVFRPEAIIIGGGVSAQGDALLSPLKAILERDIYAGGRGPSVDLIIATLGNIAGTLGAAASAFAD